MLKILFFTFIIFYFCSCSISSQDRLFLDKRNEIFLDNKVSYTHSSCTTFSYISQANDEKYGKLFTEYIDLDFNCHWYGDEKGYFLYEFKRYSKIKDMRKVQELKYGNFEFITYEINNNSYVDFIYKYSVSKSIFILDYTGKLSAELIKSFDNEYASPFINKQRFNANYSQSLVRMNMFNSYFGRMNETFIDR